MADMTLDTQSTDTQSTDTQSTTATTDSANRSSMPADSMQAEDLGTEPVFAPPTDIIETKDAVIMFLDMPGADPSSLDVTLVKRVLTASARSVPSVPEGYALVHAEYREGNYQRKFVLSDQIDGDRVEAVLTDGVLRLTLPKSTTSAVKKIPVKSA
jgi:HSP20 family molecular chaperone IbpA